MIEPEPGQDYAFNEWYGDDHFYAGGMALPSIFAGRRWLATKALRQLRLPTTTGPLTSEGCVLHLNLFQKGQQDTVNQALSTTLQHLGKEGRMYPTEIPRRHIYTAIAPYHGVMYRDQTSEGPLDIHALDYPFSGVVLEIIDAKDSATRPKLLDWLTTTFIPGAIKGSSAAMCLVCTHADLPEIIKSPRLPLKYAEGDARVALLWFLEREPQAIWQAEFAGHVESVAESELGEVTFLGPFIPTVPGTNRHIDELR
jgi:hypothetical protein